MRLIIKFTSFAILIFFCNSKTIAQIDVDQDIEISESHKMLTPTYLGPPSNNPVKRRSKFHNKHGKKLNKSIQNSTFDVTYIGFSAQAEAAFQYAVDIWESTIHSDVPIRIEAKWSALGYDPMANTNTAGQAGPATFDLGPSFPFANTLYPIALANHIEGNDIVPGEFHIEAEFNSDIPNWYLGTDANPGPTQADFVTVVLHEIGHGLGFIGGDYNNGTAIFQGSNNDIPLVWSHFVERGDGTAITDFPNGSSDLTNALISNDLYFNGSFANANNGGNRPRLFAPDPFDGGASYSHLNPVPSSPLMEPVVDAGEAKHSLTDYELGMFYDMGWAPFPGTPVYGISCNDFNGTINLNDYLLCEDTGGEWFVNSAGNSTTGLALDGTFTPLGSPVGLYFFEYKLPLGIMSTVLFELRLVNSGDPISISSVCTYSSDAIQLTDLLANENPNGAWTLHAGSPVPNSGFDNINGTFTPDGNMVGTYEFDYTVNGTMQAGSDALQCIENKAGVGGAIFGPGTYASRADISVSNCTPDTRAEVWEDFMIKIDVTAYDGPAGQMVISIRDAACSSPSYLSLLYNSDVGTYYYFKNDFPSTIDPKSGFCIIIFDSSASMASDIQFTAELTIDYPEVPDTGCTDKVSTVEVNLSDCPLNDLCSGAFIISCGEVATGTTNLATNENLDNCNGANENLRGVWYIFHGNDSYVDLSTCSNNTNFDTELHVYEGACMNLTCTEGGYNDDDNSCVVDGLQSRLSFYAVSGTSYYIWVSPYAEFQPTGDFELSVSCQSCDDITDSDLDGIPTCIDLCPDKQDISLHFQTNGDLSSNSDYVQVPHDPAFNLTDGSFAFEAWVYPISQVDFKTIVSKGHGGNSVTEYIFNISPDPDNDFNQAGKLGLFLGDGNGNAEWQFGQSKIPPNQWSHVAVSLEFNGTIPTATFFYNGTIDAVRSYTIVSAPLYNADTTPLYIGRQGAACNCNFMDGRIDELAIWDKPLTETDVLNSISAPYTGTETGLIAYYDFNDANACADNISNITATDKVNERNGTLMNFSLSQDVCISNWDQGHNTGSCIPLCPPELTLTGLQAMSFLFESDSYIISDQEINAPFEVDYNATTEISMLQNFEVELGAVFHAYILGCVEPQ